MSLLTHWFLCHSSARAITVCWWRCWLSSQLGWLLLHGSFGFSHGCGFTLAFLFDFWGSRLTQYSFLSPPSLSILIVVPSPMPSAMGSGSWLARFLAEVVRYVSVGVVSVRHPFFSSIVWFPSSSELSVVSWVAVCIEVRCSWWGSFLVARAREMSPLRIQLRAGGAVYVLLVLAYDQ